ncbi:MAG: 6-bladed beta-propeller, partial [Tannerellaceae bacterium]|nr:6-bladed beta-propeller [Tannerellaceae bacterium]
MKNPFIISATILLVLAGCGESRQPAGDLITVDVTADYPKTELILQDFMDVEYIPLETSDEFITQGSVRAVGKDIIVVTNRINDGNIFIFDRNGKALRKINR